LVSLGERIRKIRKQKKMTLEILAGSELTKGMLSLIENNKAMPSMESLTYIAERLGVEVTELLEEVSSHELREVLEEAEKLFKIEYDQITEVTNEYKSIIELIEPYIPKLSQGYEAARLLEIYSNSMYREGLDGWEELTDKAAQMYEKMNLTSRRAAIGTFRASVKFKEHDYQKSLEIFLNERSEIETKNAFIDPMTRVDFDYTEAILHFAVGDSVTATRIMESGIDYSRKNRLFYRIDDLYRLAVTHAMMTKDKKKIDYYAMKLKQYGDFADDSMSLTFYDLITIQSLISIEHDYLTALEMLNRYVNDFNEGDIHNPFILLEKGKALYSVGRYTEALSCLEKVKILSIFHHPFDLSILYEMDSYKALCHLKLENIEQALQAAKLAVVNIRPLPDTPYKDFIYETLEFIKSEVEGKKSASD
jgi:transcriptional regulator with XRE-family HTH domain